VVAVYIAALGRWVSRDPSEESGDVNLYDYVINAPISMSDPSGLAPPRPIPSPEPPTKPIPDPDEPGDPGNPGGGSGGIIIIIIVGTVIIIVIVATKRKNKFPDLPDCKDRECCTINVGECIQRCEYKYKGKGQGKGLTGCKNCCADEQRNCNNRHNDEGGFKGNCWNRCWGDSK
jgi:uncharacterized protein RhaS with RHS repeats